MITKKEIYQRLVNNFKEKFAELSGLNVSELELREGDILKAIFDSFSEELFLRYIQIINFYNSFSLYNVSGEALDLRAKDFNLTRMPGTVATGMGQLILTRAPGDTKQYIVDLSRTLVSTEDGTKVYVFDTSKNSTAEFSGNTTQIPNLIIQSNKPGILYNEEIGKVNTIKTLAVSPPLVSGTKLSFVNTTAITGGSDREEDELFRERIFLKLAGTSKGTYSYYLNKVRNYNLPSGRKIINASIKEFFLSPYSYIYVYIGNETGNINDHLGNIDIEEEITEDNYLLSYKIIEVPVYVDANNPFSIEYWPDYLGNTSYTLVRYPGDANGNWDYEINEATGEIVFNGGNNRVNLQTPGLVAGNKIHITGKYLTGDYNALQLLLNSDDERVAGVNMKVMPIVPYIISSIDIGVRLKEGIDLETIKPDVKRGVDRYIQVLKPGDDFIVSKLIDFIYSETSDTVVDIQVLQPANNIPVNPWEKVIYETLSIG